MLRAVCCRHDMPPLWPPACNPLAGPRHKWAYHSTIIPQFVVIIGEEPAQAIASEGFLCSTASCRCACCGDNIIFCSPPHSSSLLLLPQLLPRLASISGSPPTLFRAFSAHRLRHRQPRTRCPVPAAGLRAVLHQR